MSAPENPPAFPVEWSPGLEPGEPMQTADYRAQYPGMTLRDWFAGRAPEPPATWWGGGGKTCAGYAMWGYQYADAMLAAREEAAA